MATFLIIMLILMGAYVSYIAWSMLCEMSGDKHYSGISAVLVIVYTTISSACTLLLPLLYCRIITE